MSSVRVEKNGAVTTVILDRPHARNAVDGPTAMALFEAFTEFDADESASVAVLWGDHGTFCAGADLKAIGTPTPTRSTGLAWLPRLGPMGPSRMVLSKPVIAAVSGYAVAGGLELAVWCDLRVAEEDAVFGVFCRRWGVPLIDGGTVRLPRLIGHGRAMDMILTGRAVAADEALAIGLADRVVLNGQAAGPPRSWPPSWPLCRRAACGPTGCRRCTSGGTRRPRQWTSSSAACRRCPPNHWKAHSVSPRARAGTDPRFNRRRSRHPPPPHAACFDVPDISAT